MQKDVSTTRSPVLAHTVARRQVLWPRHLTIVALALLPLLVFLRAALLRGVFYTHDVQYYFYPYHSLVANLVTHGQPPLWNPAAFSGIPLLGDGQTAIFYPPNWLFLFLSGGAALNYDVMLQFSIAGVGMYLLARSLGLGRLPAFVGAVGFMFCGFMTARVVHLSILSGAALIPWLFFCVERALRTGARRWFAAAAGVVGIQAMAGHPQVPVYTALALGLYTLVRVAERWYADGDARWLLRLPLRLAGIYTLGYALAAIQLVPWIELGSSSPRAAGASFDFVFGGSMVGSHWLLLLFPYLYGSLQPSIYSAQPLGIVSAVKLWEHSAYVGILPLGLATYALLGLRHVPRRTKDQGPKTNDQTTNELGENIHGNESGVGLSSLVVGRARWFSLCTFALLLIVALVMAAGRHTPLASLIYAAPVIGKLRDVERAMALVDFALAMLAALGLQRVIDRNTVRHGQIWRPSLLAICLATVLLPLSVVLLARQPAFQKAFFLEPQEIAHLQLLRPNAAVPLALALASAALLLWWSQRPATPLTQALAAGLVLLDLGSYAAMFTPTADPQLYQRRPEVLAAFRSDSAPFRKATFLPGNDLTNRAAQETLAVSWGMVYGVQDINGFNSLQPRRYTDYLFGPQVNDVSYGQLPNERLLRPESPILSSLNVKYLLVPAALHPNIGSTFRQVYANDQVRVYENSQVYPRAYFVDTVRGENDPQAVLRAVTADRFDGRRLALVEGAQPPALPSPSAALPPPQATIAQFDANRIAIATSTGEQRFLVLSEMYFPGWRAAVDGVETPIYRTNYLFRGVVVPPGQHTVTFTYRPLSVLLGAAISAVALAVVGALLLIPIRVQK